MAATATADPASALGLPTGTPVHPLYSMWAPIWRKLAHVYGGTGGFLDGTYLIAHAREWEDWSAANPSKPTTALKARRQLARYENVAAQILDQKRDAIFRESVTRTIGGKSRKDTGDHPLWAWWDSVDGDGCHISDYMADAFTVAGTFGHAVHLMDRPLGPAPLTKAEEQAPYMRAYTPLDLVDWRTDDRGRLTAVRLLEADEQPSIEQPMPSTAEYRERVVTATSWKVVKGRSAQALGTGDHRMGTLPIVVQYAKRRVLTQVIGTSILSDPQLFIDLYNLTSEIRTLLRDQTFGVLNVQLGMKEGERITVDQAIAMLGDTTGPSNVLFTPGQASFLQPDTSNVEVYQKERSELYRMICRLCAIPWESDSRDAEAEGSLKLKREDMNQILAGYADRCEKAEYGIAKLWFRAQYGPDRWQQEWDKSQVVIRYPDTFDVTPFEDILQQAQSAITLEMGPVFMAELKKRLVAKFLPDAAPEKVAEIEQDIERMVQELADADAAKRKAELEAIANPDARFAA